MEAKNLRIGNIVMLDGDWIEIEAKHFNDDNIADISVVECCTPIPLIKELALDFGGELIEDGFDSDEGGLVCVIDYDVLTLKWSAQHNYWKVYHRMTKEWQSIEDLYIAKVRFVHEWQNLFFALRSKDLQFKNESECL